MPRPEVKIFIDGGARGNPGPAGFGVVVSGPAGEPLGRYFGYIGVATNNVAEYRGLLAALEHARARGWSRVWVGSDSELMVRQLRGEYRVKNEGLRPLFERCRALASGLAQFTIEHLPRAQNAEADGLANQAMNLRVSDLPPGVSGEAPGAGGPPAGAAPAAGSGVWIPATAGRAEGRESARAAKQAAGAPRGVAARASRAARTKGGRSRARVTRRAAAMDRRGVAAAARSRRRAG